MDDVSFEVETDPSDYAIAAILSQEGRPVAYMVRNLNSHEEKYHEKEACAIIEATRKWSQFFNGRHFTLSADQCSVTFMFDQQNRCKIKNVKLLAWRLELSQLTYKCMLQTRKGTCCSGRNVSYMLNDALDTKNTSTP